MDFLRRLRDDVRSGLRKLDPLYLDLHTQWLLAQAAPEGGFRNRRGNSEIYYTAFGLRALSCLDALAPEICAHHALWLQRQFAQPDAVRLRSPGGAFGDIVAATGWWDAVTLCDEQLKPLGRSVLKAAEHTEAVRLTLDLFKRLKRPDGGYAKTDLEGHGSLYHTFIAVCALSILNREVPERDALKVFLKAREHPEGGFLENAYSKRPGTNGTAAGLALQWSLGKVGTALAMLLGRSHKKHIHFLTEMRGSEGGFLATPAAPFDDLLSTFTGLYMLRNLGAADQATLDRALLYAQQLEQPHGGYVGFALEQTADCEYTFYGLGVESLAYR